ncbi:MAG: hypothetical protein WA142_02150 [Rugosibacter sp.]
MASSTQALGAGDFDMFNFLHPLYSPKPFHYFWRENEQVCGGQGDSGKAGRDFLLQ